MENPEETAEKVGIAALIIQVKEDQMLLQDAKTPRVDPS